MPLRFYFIFLFLFFSQGNVNIWIELVKWIFRISHHTLPGLLLGILEKLNNYSKASEDFTKLLMMCTDLRNEIKVRYKRLIDWNLCISIA